MTENETANDKKSAIITVIGIASTLWLLVCIWLFWVAAAPCDATQVGWYARKVSCMASNEMGDSLAGAFAPLAFLWLIAAVFLQRNELAAQRQELRDSRAVAVQQVEEARKNVRFIEAQTKILEAARMRSDIKEAEDDISEMIDLTSRIFDEVAVSFSTWTKRLSKDDATKPAATYNFAAASSLDKSDRLREHVSTLSMLHFEIVELSPALDKFVFRAIERLEAAVESLAAIDKISETASLPKQALLVYISVKQGVTEGRELVSFLRANGRSRGIRDMMDYETSIE